MHIVDAAGVVRSVEVGDAGSRIIALCERSSGMTMWVGFMVGQDAWIAVYIMASARNGTLYTGVTSALLDRVRQHKLGTFDGFSKGFGCKTLVWYETHPTMPVAIKREKRVKRWRRDWTLALVETENPQWRDLSEGWFETPEGPLSGTQRA